MFESMADQNARDEAHWEASEEGAELLREGERDAAVAELSRCITEQPDNPYAHYFLGAAYFELRDLPRALKAYLRAIELKADYLGALHGAGWVLHAMGRYREALRLGRQVLARSKEDPDALHLMGLCHYAMADGAAAAAYLDRFLATRPEVEVAYEVQALLEVLRGKAQDLPEQDDD
jgi:tetratricopeptide (TPR) repeat protein